jgi:hypothetical protein
MVKEELDKLLDVGLIKLMETINEFLLWYWH